MDHDGAEGAQSWGRADGQTGGGGVMGLEAEVKLGDPHQRAELGIKKAEAEPKGWMEIAERAEPRS